MKSDFFYSSIQSSYKLGPFFNKYPLSLSFANNSSNRSTFILISCSFKGEKSISN
jgi:hypothetical protein